MKQHNTIINIESRVNTDPWQHQIYGVLHTKIRTNLCIESISMFVFKVFPLQFLNVYTCICCKTYNKVITNGRLWGINNSFNMSHAIAQFYETIVNHYRPFDCSELVLTIRIILNSLVCCQLVGSSYLMRSSKYALNFEYKYLKYQWKQLDDGPNFFCKRNLIHYSTWTLLIFPWCFTESIFKIYCSLVRDRL